VSLSPLEERASDPYVNGWLAANRLMRQGWSWSGGERNCAFLNTRGARFADVSAASGFAFPDDGRAGASIDWDEDGALDFVVSNRTGPRARILLNRQRGTNDALALQLVGTRGHASAIGARVEVELVRRAADAPLERRVASRRAGEGYLAQSSAWLHFGLGTSEVERVRVLWPGGAQQEYVGFGKGGRWRLVEGEREPQLVQARATSGLAQRIAAAPAPATAAAPKAGAARIVLRAALPLPRLPVVAADGSAGELVPLGPPAEGARALLVNLWASWCAPCAVELRALERERAAFDARGLRLLALGIEGEASRAQELAALDAFGWSGERAFASAESAEVLDALQCMLLDTERRLPIPTSLLVNARGELVCMYLGPVEPARVLADLALLELDPAARREAAIPFPGLWYEPPFPADLTLFGRRLRERGLERAAGDLELRRLDLRRRSPAQMLIDFGRRSGSRGRFEESIAHFTSAVAADPQLFDAQHDLGVALHRAGRYREAALAYQAALRLDPGNSQALANQALAHAEAGDRAAALRCTALLKGRDEAAGEALERSLRAVWEREPAPPEPPAPPR
jgi:tetratricopeptide (TPR) repeat protein